MNKDVLLTIYEIVHRDLTKYLNAEYLQKLRRAGDKKGDCECESICKCCIAIKFDIHAVSLLYNYRSTIHNWISVYTKYGRMRCPVSKNY